MNIYLDDLETDQCFAFNRMTEFLNLSSPLQPDELRGQNSQVYRRETSDLGKIRKQGALSGKIEKSQIVIKYDIENENIDIEQFSKLSNTELYARNYWFIIFEICILS